MTIHPVAIPPPRLARFAGACYLLVIAGGMFAALFVRDPLFVPGDATATVRAISASEALWRWGIAVHALYLIPAAAFGVILYRFFRHANATLALFALVLAIVPIAIEAALLTNLFIPLAIIHESGALGAMDEAQRHALGYVGVRLFVHGWGISLLLFSGFCASIGVLIVRSRIIPRAIGMLMIGAGASYFVGNLTAIVSPALANMLEPGFFVPAFVGELSLALWLTIKGIRAPRAAIS